MIPFRSQAVEIWPSCSVPDFHSLPNCGHVPYVEALEEFVRLMDGFLPGQASSELTLGFDFADSRLLS